MSDKVQGPFNSETMEQWLKEGFLHENLMISLKGEKNFYSLKELSIRFGGSPFTSNFSSLGLFLIFLNLIF